MFRSRVLNSYPIPDWVTRRVGNPQTREYRFQSSQPLDFAFVHHTENSAVKRLLTNFDIIALVFEHFAPEYPDGHSANERLQLRNLMLTCKAFFHHAAGALWGAHMGEHCGLQHLLSIMDLCNIGEEVFQPNTAGLVTRDNPANLKLTALI
ncbi:hypothetical protein NUW54_g6115 [Trametes sanguinea]|uniref:Uncharacterized protein n=1 Tax=Trametes sanguinea TaxID=158606 RepID=A0ACC1PV21_9APHY|nr:hypothetical protein NUW54_g6115 [Trametes sanguinea]